MATNTVVMNFSLDPNLCAGLKAQAELEDRPMSRIVSRLLAEYLQTHGATAQEMTKVAA